jgi:hypothetical protein
MMKKISTVRRHFFSIVAIMVALFTILRCARDNPLDPNGSHYVPGAAPTAKFLIPSVRGFINDQLEFPVFYRDSAAIGGRAPRVDTLFFDGDAGITAIIPPVNFDTTIWKHSFASGGVKKVRFWAKDNDGQLSTRDSIWCIIDSGKPRIDSFKCAPLQVQPGEWVKITIYAHDTNGTVVQYLWNVAGDISSRIRMTDSIQFADQGQKKIILSVKDDDGVASSPDTIKIQVGTTGDFTGPALSCRGPRDGDTIRGKSWTSVAVAASDESGVADLSVGSNFFTPRKAHRVAGFDSLWMVDTLPLLPGVNTLSIQAHDRLTNLTEKTMVVVYDSSSKSGGNLPAFVAVDPPTGSVITKPLVLVQAIMDAAGVNSVVCNGIILARSPSMATKFTGEIPLALGANTLVLKASNSNGASFDTVIITYSSAAKVDTIKPVIVIVTPQNDDRIAALKDTVLVSVSDGNGSGVASVKINGGAPDGGNGIDGWSKVVALVHGYDTIRVEAFDSSANRATDSVVVVQDLPPKFSGSKDTTIADIVVNQPATFSLTAADPEGDPLSFSFLSASVTSVTLSQAGGRVTIGNFTPIDTGMVRFVLRVQDPFGGADTVTVKGRVRLPDAFSPVFITVPSEISTIAFVDMLYVDTLNVSNPSGGGDLVFSLLSPSPSAATIDIKGIIRWKPGAADTGTKTFHAQVHNAKGSSEILEWTVKVAFPDRPPQLTRPGTLVVDERKTLRYLFTASDPDMDKLHISLSTAIVDNPPLMKGDTLVWTPTYKQAGDYFFKIRVDEVGRTPALWDTAMVHVTVNDVNNPPILLKLRDTTVPEKTLLTLRIVAADSNGDAVRIVSKQPLPAGATLGANAVRYLTDGSSRDSVVFSWTPANNQAGTYPVVFYAIDSGKTPMRDSLAITIRVADTSPPHFTKTTATMKDTIYLPKVYRDTATAIDFDGDSLRYRKLAGPDSLTVDSTNGAITWAPNESATSSTSIVRVYVVDNAGLTDTLSWKISVHADTTAPQFTKGSSQMKDTAYVGSEYRDSVFAMDADGDSPIYSVKFGPITCDPVTGVIRWVPDQDAGNTQVVVSVGVTDRHGNNGKTLSWTIKVFPKWPRIFGAANTPDTGRCVVQTVDKGYAVCGTGASAFFIRTDSLGNQIAYKPYPGRIALVSLQQTSDGGFVLCGTDSTAGKCVLYKTNDRGDITWTVPLAPAASIAMGESVCLSADGGYVVCGSASGGSGYSVYLAKIAATKQVVWEKTFPGLTGTSLLGHAVQPTQDNGFIICGEARSLSTSNIDVCVIKTDPFGNAAWQKTYRKGLMDVGLSVAPAVDGGYVVGGSSVPSLGAVVNGLVLKVNTAGDTLWTRTTPMTENSMIASVKRLSDGYIACGYAPSYPTGQGQDVFLYKFSDAGDKAWYSTLGTSRTDAGTSVFPTSDGGFVVTGYTATATGPTDVYLAKTDYQGNIVK